MKKTVYNTDIAIIGAGPVGLFTVFQAGMLQLTSCVIDTLEFTGGQCTALYPEKPIYDIPGFPRISAQKLIENLELQAAPFKPTYLLGQSVDTLDINEQTKEFTLTTAKKNVIKAKAIIIAAGCGAFGPNRPPLPNIEGYENKSVFYMITKKEQLRGKKIVIAGGGDSAADWAIALCDIAEKIYVVHRRAKFRCAPDSAAKLEKLAKSGKIELVIPYQLAALKGQNGTLEYVTVKSLDGDLKELKADILLPFFGLAMELGPIANWGINLDKKSITVTPHNMQTNIPGIFAIGDIVAYREKLKLILTGFAESATACHAARKFMYPDQEFHFEYSTTKGVP